MNQKTLFVGSSAPGTTYAGQLWFNTSNNVLYQRDQSNAVWLPVTGRLPYVYDDDQASVAGTTVTQVKYVRIGISTNLPYNTVRVIASLWTSNASGTANIAVYMDGNGSPSLTLSTSSTTEVLVEGTFSVSSLAAGLHTLYFKIYNGSASYTTYTQLLEVFGEP